MKVILRNYGIRMTSEERQVARATARDLILARGTGSKPNPPQDLHVQSGPRGILLNWRASSKESNDVAGYRIYKDDENSLFAEVRDPSTTEHFVESTAGTTPPTTNLFVSTYNKLGVESAKVQIQGSATAETGAPTMPTTPPTFTRPFINKFNPFL